MKLSFKSIAAALLLIALTQSGQARADFSHQFVNSSYTILNPITCLVGQSVDVYWGIPAGESGGVNTLMLRRIWFYERGTESYGPYEMWLRSSNQLGISGINTIGGSDTVPLTCSANEEVPYSFRLTGYTIRWMDKVHSYLNWRNHYPQEEFVTDYGWRTFQVK